MKKQYVIVELEEYKTLLIAYGQYQVIVGTEDSNDNQELIGYDTNTKESNIKCKRLIK